MRKRIAVLPGDGVGPEVMHEAKRVLHVIGEQFGHRFDLVEALIGGAAINETGAPLPRETVAISRTSDAVLLGAVGGPEWDHEREEHRPEQGLLQLRKTLGVYANLRPINVYKSLISVSPFKNHLLNDVDVLIVRELTGGLYFGQPRVRRKENSIIRAIDTLTYTDEEIERILHKAFQIAETRRKQVTSVDKANVLESSRLWRELAEKVSMDYPAVTLHHMLVDHAAMQLIRCPSQFDVIVTENMFGDILSDEASMLAGSIGLLPSASLGISVLGLYEPIHGSAPDIAGQQKANPIAMLASVALMLEYSFHLKDEADVLIEAIESVLDAGYRTADLTTTSNTVSTEEMGNLVCQYIVNRVQA